MYEMTWKQFFTTLFVLMIGGLIAFAILAYYNPYLKHLEKDIGSSTRSG